jgi:hypothetical protein
VAKAIVQAVQQQEPPGRFLEKADLGMKLWREIDYKRCVHKTSQALREKDRSDDYSHPASAEAVVAGQNALGEIDTKLKALAEHASQKNSNKRKNDEVDLSDLTNATLRRAGFRAQSNPQRLGHQQMNDERGTSSSTDSSENPQAKKSFEFTKPAWWGQGIPTLPSSYRQYVEEHGVQTAMSTKRRRISRDDTTPLPPESSHIRHSSMFNFLNGSGIFGRDSFTQMSMGVNHEQQPVQPNQGSTRSSGLFSFSGGVRSSWFGGSQPEHTQLRNPSLLISLEASNFGDGMNDQQSLGRRTMNQTTAGIVYNRGINTASMEGYTNPSDPWEEMPAMPTMGLNDTPRRPPHANTEVIPPAMNRLTSQVSDWLTSFLPVGTSQEKPAAPQNQDTSPPMGDNLERSVSSSIFGLVRSPSQFLTNLKSGVTSMFGGTADLEPVSIAEQTATMRTPISSISAKRDSLLDDYDETPMEAQLRMLSPI